MDCYMKTTGKSYRSKICQCEKCGEVFESCVTYGSYEIILCPKCSSKNISVEQRTLATVKEEKEMRDRGNGTK